MLIPIYGLRPRKGDAKTITDPNAFHLAIGSILGDGMIHKRDLNQEISSKSARYAVWKYNLAKKYGLISVQPNKTKPFTLKLANRTWELKLPTTVKRHKVKDKSKTGKDFYYSFTFVTRSVFNDPLWRSSFYELLPNPKKTKEYRKKLPQNISNLFTSDLALAIWYLDDGTFDPAKQTVRISVGEWTEQECEWMQECLSKNFNMNSSVYKSTGVPHHIYVHKESYPEFYRRVEPWINNFLKNHPTAKFSVGVAKKLRLTKP